MLTEAHHNFMAQARSMSSEFERIRAWRQANLGKFETRMLNVGSTDVLEISVLDFIGYMDWFGEGVTSKAIKKAMDAAPNVPLIRVLINSPGGYTDEGIAIQSLLKRHPAQVDVEVLGMMASAATLVAMGGDEIAMHQGAYAMIHQCSSYAGGFEADLLAAAKGCHVSTESVIDLYKARNGKTDEEVRKAVMDTTYFTAAEAVAWGLADKIIPATAGVVLPVAAPVEPEPVPDPNDDGLITVASYRRRRVANLLDNRGAPLVDRPRTTASERRFGASRLV